MNSFVARLAGAVSAFSLGLTAPAAAQKAPSASAYKAPHTEWGDPDLRGMWPLEVGNTRMQRDAKYGNQAWLTDAEYAEALKAAQTRGAGADKEDQDNKLGAGHWFEYGTVLRQTSLIMQPANGRIPPMTAQGQAMAKAMHSSWDNDLFSSVKDFNSLDRCITRGMPASMIPFPYNNGVQIFQAPGYVVLNLELIHETRIIPLDRSGASPGAIQTWLGDSRGHWEGQTLVVETIFVKSGIWGDFTPVMFSEKARFDERYRQIDANTIENQVTITDPVALTKPWTYTKHYSKMKLGSWVADPETCGGPDDRNPIVNGRVTVVLPSSK